MAKIKKKKSLSLVLRNYFITGVVVLIPIGFTLYLSKILIGVSSNIIPPNINPNNYLPFAIPGIEIIISIIFITIVGGLSLSFLGKRILKLIDDLLAAKEIYIARHYIKKEKWIAAINRLKIIVSNYDTTIYIEEALHRLVEVYYIIGLEEESKKYAKTLGYNYQSSKWYKESYRIFNKDYKVKKIDQKNESKKNLLDKIKSFFIGL